MKQHAPATSRNREALGAVLDVELPSAGLVLEVASGSGEHAIYFAGRYPALEWQPSDQSPDALASISSWRDQESLNNLREPIRLDASAADWPVATADAILCVNMVHISPWRATEGLFAGSARLLAADEPLILYGPYLEDDVDTAASNLAFDESLKARDARWGIRRLADMDSLASGAGFMRAGRVEMPANNLTLTYRKS